MAVVSNSTKDLAKIRSDVYFLMSENPDSSIFSKDSVNSAVNMGLTLVHNTTHTDLTRIASTASVGVSSILIPEASTQNGNAIVDSVLFSGTELTPQEYSDNTSQSGTPTSYAVIGNTLYLYPSPSVSGDLVVLYRREFKPLVDDSDVPNMSDIEINSAVLYAVYILKLKDEEFASADRFFSAFEDSVKRSQTLQSGVYSPTSATSYGGVV